MSYHVKEIFSSLQGEGYHTGRPAVFVRFSGCNLWSGKQEHRQNSICDFCDTDFLGTDGENGGVYALGELIGVIGSQGRWAAGSLENIKNKSATPRPRDPANPLIILTGGEPMLQVDKALITALHERGFYIAMETNGTKKVPDSIDWITVSPKMGAELVQKTGNELKLVYPQEGIDPNKYLELDFEHFYLQPKDGVDFEKNKKICEDYCSAHPQWRLGLQMHKVWGID